MTLSMALLTTLTLFLLSFLLMKQFPLHMLLLVTRIVHTLFTSDIWVSLVICQKQFNPNLFYAVSRAFDCSFQFIFCSRGIYTCEFLWYRSRLFWCFVLDLVLLVFIWRSTSDEIFSSICFAPPMLSLIRFADDIMSSANLRYVNFSHRY